MFDEPSAIAGAREAAHTLDMIRILRDAGVGVLLASQAVGELFAVCDRVMVLRRGRKVAERAVADTSPDELARHLAGDPVVA